jgi:RNA polymerase sigma factor (sigma-70 family)
MTSGAVVAAVLSSADKKQVTNAPLIDRIHYGDGSTMNLKSAPIREVLEYFLDTQDSAAWAEFAIRIRPYIRAAVARRLRKSNQPAPRELVEDLEQEAHVKLIAHNYQVLRNLRWIHDEAIFPYATVIATHVALDWMRKNKIDPNPLDENENPEIHLRRSQGDDNEILRRQIDRCLFTLAGEPHFKRDRAIFWLYYRWGYRAGQIAKLPSVNLPVKTVENILLRLRVVIRSRLEADGHKGKVLD